MPLHVDTTVSVPELSIPIIETRAWRISCVLLLIAWLAFFSVWAHAYWVPANGAADQNAYLVAAKLFALTGTPRLRPTDPSSGNIDPFHYIGPMWVPVNIDTPSECYYPKYPFGAWAIQGLVFKVAGPTAVYYVSPIAMLVALLFLYLIIRLCVGSLAGLLGVIMFSSTGTVLALTNSPCSHAIGLAVVNAGMYALIRSTHDGQARWALVAAFVLGCAVTIRYIDGVLIVPLLATTALSLDRQARSINRGNIVHMALALAVWSIPVSMVVLYNIVTIGSLTGYDATGESIGFSWNAFRTHWSQYVWLLNNIGMPYVFALGVAGMAVMHVWNWRRALVLLLWGIPGLLACMAYYFAPNTRFLVPLIPPFIVCALWLVSWPIPIVGDRLRLSVARDGIVWRSRVAMVLAVVGVLVYPLLIELPRQWTEVRMDQAEWANVAAQANEIMAIAPAGSLIFAEQPDDINNMFNHMQFIGDFRLYAMDAFYVNHKRIRRPDERWRSTERSASAQRRIGVLSQDQRTQALGKLIQAASCRKQRSFVISSSSDANAVERLLGYSGGEVLLRGSYVDPYSTRGRLLRTDRGEADREKRIRWYLYELVPSAVSARDH